MPPQDPYAATAEQDPYAATAEGGAAADTKPPVPKSFYQKQGAAGRYASSALSGFGVPESVQEHPSEAFQGAKLAVTHPGLEFESLKNMWNSMSESQQKLIDEAFMKQHMPGVKNKAEGFALGIYSAIPVFGPAIVNAVRQGQSGDLAGSAGSITAILMQLYRPGEAKVATAPEGGTPGVMGEIPKPKAERVRALAQGLTGSGPEATTEPIIEKYKGEVGKAGELNRAATEEAFRTAGERKAAYDAKVKEQEASHAKALNEVTQFNAEQANMKQRKTILEKQVDTESADLGKDLSTLENAVYKEANQKFDTVREKVGDAQVQPEALIGSVKDAEKNILQGIPENIKEFRSILNLEGAGEDLVKLRQDVMKGQGMSGSYDQLSTEHKALVDDIAKKYGGAVEPNEPIGWNKLQSLKTRIDARLRSRGRMNGDVKRALFSVRDQVVDEMGNLAVPAGAGPDWDAARDFYRQWKEDFHEPTGPSGSGSPVAQALNAVDPENIRKPFISKQSTIGNRGVDTLRKYGQFGGTQVADKAAKLVANESEFSSLKPKTAKPLPERPKAIPKPKDVEAEFKEVKPPTAEDLTTAKRRKLREAAVSWGKFHTYDLGILANSVIGAALFQRWEPLIADPLFVAVRKSAGRVISISRLREWIAKPLPEELSALERLPEELKDDARQTIKKQIAEHKIRPVASAVQQFLSGAGKGAGKVLRGGALGAGRKSPGQQIKDLRAIQESHGSNPALPVGPE